MAVTNDLPDSVRDSLAKGRSRAQSETILARAGRDKPYLSARQAFMYVVAVVTVPVVAGLVLVGHTSEARAGRSLPASLNDASRETGGSEPVGDPITGRLYPYQVVGVDTYELCRRLSTQFGRF
jgi:hypothetical protein